MLKRLLFGVMIVSQLCSANQIEIDQASVNENESVVIVEAVPKKHAFKKSEFTSGDSQRPDIVDMFVDSSNYESTRINIFDLWFTTLFIAGKFLYNQESPQDYLVLFGIALGITGVLKVGAYCKYYVYRFVRSAIEAITPEKILRLFNKKIKSLAPYSFVASLAGVGCAFAYYLTFGPLQQKAAIDIVRHLVGLKTSQSNQFFQGLKL